MLIVVPAENNVPCYNIQLHVYGNVMYFSWNLKSFPVSVSTLQKIIDASCMWIIEKKLGNFKNKVLRPCCCKVPCIFLPTVISFCNSTDLTLLEEY